MIIIGAIGLKYGQPQRLREYAAQRVVGRRDRTRGFGCQ
jgi:hypothetical protein